MCALLAPTGLNPIGFTDNQLAAGSLVTSTANRGTLDHLIRYKRKIRINLAYVLIGALIFATVLSWIEVLRSIFDDAFPLKSRLADPNYVRYEATFLRLYYAVVSTALFIGIIWLIVQFIHHQRENE